MLVESEKAQKEAGLAAGSSRELLSHLISFFVFFSQPWPVTWLQLPAPAAIKHTSVETQGETKISKASPPGEQFVFSW